MSSMELGAIGELTGGVAFWRCGKNFIACDGTGPTSAPRSVSSHAEGYYEGRPLKNVKLVLCAVLLGVLVIFSAQNHEVVRVQFLFWYVEMSRAVLLFLVLAIGFVIGWTFEKLLRRRAR